MYGQCCWVSVDCVRPIEFGWCVLLLLLLLLFLLVSFTLPALTLTFRAQIYGFIFTINIYASRRINAFDFLFAISLIKCAKKRNDQNLCNYRLQMCLAFIRNGLAGQEHNAILRAAEAIAKVAAAAASRTEWERVKLDYSRSTHYKRNEHLINT